MGVASAWLFHIFQGTRGEEDKGGNPVRKSLGNDRGMPATGAVHGYPGWVPLGVTLGKHGFGVITVTSVACFIARLF